MLASPMCPPPTVHDLVGLVGKQLACTTNSRRSAAYCALEWSLCYHGVIMISLVSWLRNYARSLTRASLTVAESKRIERDNFINSNLITEILSQVSSFRLQRTLLLAYTWQARIVLYCAHMRSNVEY